jgi:hypothetical protein
MRAQHPSPETRQRAALLGVAGAQRFHHIHHRDVGALVELLRRARLDRSSLRSGPPGCGVTRQQAAAITDRLLCAVTDIAGMANAGRGAS